MLAGREQNASRSGRFSSAECCHLSQRYIPADGPTVVDALGSRAYIGQFSADGSLFVAAFQKVRLVSPPSLLSRCNTVLSLSGRASAMVQDQTIRVYDTERGWALHKEILARNLRWTITDTALSPDQRFLVYASITPLVHLVNVGSESSGVQDWDASFGIWSLQFSSDGREIVAGASDHCLYLYDVEANKPSLKLEAHK
eukprot:SM004671S16630  [mRNA]  locus=s4671:36:1122:- [translate_table: standard]